MLVLLVLELGKFDLFVPQSEPAHQLIHGISVEKLGVARDADLSREPGAVFVIDGEVALVIEAGSAVEAPTKVAVFQLFDVGVSAAVAAGPLLHVLEVVGRERHSQVENRVVHVEHHLDFVIDLDLKQLSGELIVLLLKCFALLLRHVIGGILI